MHLHLQQFDWNLSKLASLAQLHEIDACLCCALAAGTAHCQCCCDLLFVSDMNDLEPTDVFAHTSNLLSCTSSLRSPATVSVDQRLDVHQVLDMNKSLTGSSRFMTLTRVRAIGELRLPFTTSYAKWNIAAKRRERCQMTFFCLL